MTTDERFWSKVEEDGNTKCLIWVASKTKDGYGYFWNGTKLVLAHRWVWEQHNGPIPEGLKILHHCDTPACVRYECLFMGTDADNKKDSVTKARHHKPVGVSNGRSKLTLQDAREIRILRQEGWTGRALAEKYKVTEPMIWHILKGRNWNEAGL